MRLNLAINNITAWQCIVHFSQFQTCFVSEGLDGRKAVFPSPILNNVVQN